MIAIPLLLIWAGYAAGFWGVSLLKGWNLSLKQIISPAGYYAGKWPPAQAGNTVIIPDGTQASLTDVALPAVPTATSTSSTSSKNGGGNRKAPPPPKGVAGRAQIQKAAARYGWGKGSNWNSLLQIIAHESGGNPNATNSSSGAYGIAQALGHGGSNTAGCGRNEYGGYGLSPEQAKQANCGNAWYQLIWMMNYIKQAYGSPDKAWAQYCNHPGGGCWY